MALTLPKGVQFGFAQLTAAVAIAVTSLENGVNPAFESASPLTDETPYLLKAPGWALANNKVVVARGDTFAGLDTTDAELFPAGGYAGGAGSSVMALGEFVDFTQQGDPTTSGGEQQYWTGTLLEDPLGRQISLPTFKNAKQLTIPLYFDPNEAWYAKAKAVDAKGRPVVLRAKMPTGDVLYWYGYLSFDADPSIAANTPMGNVATFTILGESTLVRNA